MRIEPPDRLGSLAFDLRLKLPFLSASRRRCHAALAVPSEVLPHSDVLFWQSDPLDHDLTIEGDIIARLFASATGSDADWVVKLIDVYPDDAATPAGMRGRQRMIANEIFRGRFRTGFDKPGPIAPKAVLSYTIDLHAAAHAFLKGHRIALQVQSSWFPLIDRNPQTYVANILKATPGDFKAQTHKVYHAPGYASRIEVPVVDRGH